MEYRLRFCIGADHTLIAPEQPVLFGVARLLPTTQP